MAFLSTGLQQFPHIAHQHLHLRHIKERGATLLTLVDTSDTMKDQWEVLKGRDEPIVGLVVWLPHVSTDLLSLPAV